MINMDNLVEKIKVLETNDNDVIFIQLDRICKPEDMYLMEDNLTARTGKKVVILNAYQKLATKEVKITIDELCINKDNVNKIIDELKLYKDKVISA